MVEDDLEVASTLVASFASDGHDVETAGDGESAIASAKARGPDAVVLDLRHRDMTGFELAQKLRAGILDESSVILAVTGRSDGTHEEAERSGIDLVLRKPVDQSLIASLLAFLQRQRTHARGGRPPVRR